jgi:ribosomal protein L11 methyltransferase
VPDAELGLRAAAALETVCATVSVFEQPSSGDRLVEGFAVRAPDRGRLATALALAWAGRGDPPAPRIEKLPPRDWLGENQRNFPPLRAGRYFIHGSHHRGPVPAGAIGLLIDAATAFGTGDHASTRGCLLALDALARRRRFRRVLDVGTGTGILAIAAAKTWRRRVFAVDIDANAVAVARVNARRNGAARQIGVAWSRGYRSRAVARHLPADLVLANILAVPLALMARDLARALAPGGFAVLSGLLAEQANLVLAAHRAQRLYLRRRVAIDGWHTLVLGRSAASFPGENT